MNYRNALWLPTFALLSLSLFGCLAYTEAPEEGDLPGSAQQPLRTENSLTSNSLTSSSLTSISLTSSSLTSNSLTSISLTSNSLVMSAMTDPKSREVLRYVVGCALPAGQSITLTVAGTSYQFDGQLGVYKDWGISGQTCGARCQTQVSSCVVARLNYLGQQVNISVRGGGGLLTTTASERSAYPKREGVYFGNIFVQPQLLYACLPPGTTSLPRVCGPSLTGCAVQVRPTCDCGVMADDGSLNECSWDDGYPNQDDQVTVFLQ